MLAKTLGFAAAVMICPMIAGVFALLDSAVDGSFGDDVRRLRVGMKRPSVWMAAANQPIGDPPAFRTTYRVPLRIDTADSAMERYELEMVLEEVNGIWAQAGICFDMRDVRLTAVRSEQLVLRFVAGDDEMPVYGMYDGSGDMWTLDAPDLARSPHPTRHPAARTSSHELGHALTLRHRNGWGDSIDSLMASGRRGYRLHPAEVQRARAAARVIGEPNRPCGPARLL